VTTATEPGRIILRMDAAGLHGVCMPSTALLSQDWYRRIERGGDLPEGIALTGEAVDLVRFELVNGTWVYRLIEYDGLKDAWLIRWVD